MDFKGLRTPGKRTCRESGLGRLVLKRASHLQTHSWGDRHADDHSSPGLRERGTLPASKDLQPAISGAGRAQGAYKSSRQKEMSAPRGPVSRAERGLSWKLS